MSAPRASQSPVRRPAFTDTARWADCYFTTPRARDAYLRRITNHTRRTR